MDTNRSQLRLQPVAYTGTGDGATANPFGLTVNFWIIFALFWGKLRSAVEP